MPRTRRLLVETRTSSAEAAESASGQTSSPEPSPEPVPPPEPKHKRHKSAKCPKSKSVGGGWANFRATTLSHFPAGPQNINELFNWPEDVTDSVMGLVKFKHRDVLKTNIDNHMKYGVDIVTDYSGMDCPRWCMQPIEQALRRRYSCPPAKRKRRHSIEFHRSCDKGNLQKNLLKAISNSLDEGGTCVFEDLMDRLPLAAQVFIKKLTPHEKMTPDEKVNAYNDIRSWLHENRQWCYPPDATSYCIVHKKCCKAFPDVHLPIANPDDTTDEEFQHRPLQVEVAGVTCLGWTSAGTQARETHESELAHAVWMEERTARAEAGLEDVGFIECGPRYPAEQRLGKENGNGDNDNQGIGDLSHVHSAVYVRTGPEYMGHPSTRFRVLGALINNSTTIWTGPVGQALQDDFRDAFWRSPQLTGKDLLCNSEDSRWQYYMSLAGSHWVGSVDDLKALPDWELMTYLGPPGMAQRHHEWRSWMFENHWIQGGVEDFMVDLDHHPGTRGCTGGRDFPTQMCHGTVAALSASSWRLVTPLERFCALGFHALPAVCTQWPECDLMRILCQENISRSGLHRLTGNAMHLATQAAWMLYVISHCARRDWYEGCPCKMLEPSHPEEGPGSEADDERESQSIA